MNKKVATVILFLSVLIALWALVNSDSYILAIAKYKLEPVLEQGTNKAEVISYLNKKGLSANEGTTHHANGSCATAKSGNFRWNCEYPSYVHTGWSTGFLHFRGRHIELFFVFNEKNQLVSYYTSVGYEFF